jgi:putative membrane protein
MEIADLPALNASLNGLASVFLIVGYALIRSGRRDAHRLCMLTALATSALFLISYVVYHANAGSVRFQGTGAIRVVYFAVLVPHVILAATILPLALITTARGLRGDFGRHVRIARWTLPVWLYVSVTGVIVYAMLYHLY